MAAQLQRNGGQKPTNEDEVVTVKKKGEKGMRKGVASKDLDISNGKHVINQHTPKGSKIPNMYIHFTLSTHAFSSCSLLTE